MKFAAELDRHLHSLEASPLRQQGRLYEQHQLFVYSEEEAKS